MCGVVGGVTVVSEVDGVDGAVKLAGEDSGVLRVGGSFWVEGGGS